MFLSVIILIVFAMVLDEAIKKHGDLKTLIEELKKVEE